MVTTERTEDAERGRANVEIGKAGNGVGKPLMDTDPERLTAGNAKSAEDRTIGRANRRQRQLHLPSDDNYTSLLGLGA